MKKRKIFEILTTSIFSFGLIAGNCNKSTSEVSAADAWTKVDTRVIASSSAFVNGSEAYTFVKLSVSDYTSMPSSYAQAHNTILPNYSFSDYNFKSKILFSSDNINYVAYSDISNDFNFLWGDSTFRLGFLEGTYTYKQMANFKYIKIEEGCEFPSYAYCSGGSTKTKYVQSETTISTIVAAATADATSGVQGYKEFKENAQSSKRMLQFLLLESQMICGITPKNILFQDIETQFLHSVLGELISLAIVMLPMQLIEALPHMILEEI